MLWNRIKRPPAPACFYTEPRTPTHSAEPFPVPFSELFPGNGISLPPSQPSLTRDHDVQKCTKDAQAVALRIHWHWTRLGSFKKCCCLHFTLEILIQLVWDGAQALVIFKSFSADSNVKPELKTLGLT